ncbi:hypothetical protein ACFPYI_07800 [Halomarina salina]|uniref:Uncharacterized protein n=1 Tax=Halomarina salina TaxID=1872699 RepID=A0ABD5RLK2_9EURY|nr:hypothetical protein [Halomarina salina]
MNQPPDGERDHPLDGVADHWEAVIDDMATTAEQLREAGADVVELHPGDITPLPALGGFDVLVPDGEFDALRDVVADATLSETDVFQAEAAGVVFTVAVLAASDGSAAVCCPLYYDRADEEVTALHRDVTDDGPLRVFVRTLSNDEAVGLTFDDPSVFFDDTERSSDDPEETA